MKKLQLLGGLLLISAVALCQAKDTTQGSEHRRKRIPMPPGAKLYDPNDSGQIKERYYYLVMPESNWNLIMSILQRSDLPSNQIADQISYIQRHVREVVLTPVPDTARKK